LGYKAYLRPGALVVMLLGSFRDDIFDALELERDALLRRGTERRSLDELTSVELDTIFGAAGILLGRFIGFMDDPALPDLLEEFRRALNKKDDRHG
jgi:hypothetical protein